jgi:hypothetical protein
VLINSQATAQDFLGFFKNFQDTFGIKNFKIYVTGESYAGRYVPYISAAMLDAKNKEYYDLNGKVPFPRRLLFSFFFRRIGIRPVHRTIYPYPRECTRCTFC